LPNIPLTIDIISKLDSKGTAELRQELKTVVAEMDRLRNSGQSGSDAFKQLQNRAGEVTSALKGVTRENKGLDSDFKRSSDSVLNLGKNLTVIAFGIKEAITGLANFGKQLFDVASRGAELSNFRKGFEEIEGSVSKANEQLVLLRQATAGNLNDAEIIKLSNGIKALGFSSVETAQFLDLAERRTDIFGGTIQNVSSALERFLVTGNKKGALALKFDLEEINQEMLKPSGLSEKKLKDLDDESLRQLRLSAVLKLYGNTIDEINSKEKDQGGLTPKKWTVS